MFDIGILIALLCVTYFSGTYIERKHLKSLADREKELTPLPVITHSEVAALGEADSCRFVSGSVVIAADFFRYKLSQLVSLFGGNISGLERLLVRARKEAELRMREDAKGADALADVRLETSMLNDKDSSALPIVEVYAYGTAIYLKR